MLKRMMLAGAAGLACVAQLVAVAPAEAQDGLVEFRVLAPRLAAELALETMVLCEAKGFQVAVAVVDRFGVPQAVLRNRFAGPHTPDTAARKAWTSVSFRENTLALVEATGPGTPQAGARDITGALMLGGGVVIDVGGQMVGAVGVSGAPSGEEDEACAMEGLDSIQDRLPL